MLLSEGMDEGAMLHKVTVPVTIETTSESLFQQLSTLGAEVLPDVLASYASGTLKAEEQDASLATYCGKIEKEMGEIHPLEETAEHIYHKWQAFTPWPGIYLFEQGKRIKIITFAPSIQEESHIQIKEHSGAFIISTTKKLYLHTSSGCIEILQIQPEGKKVLTATEYISGLK